MSINFNSIIEKLSQRINLDGLIDKAVAFIKRDLMKLYKLEIEQIIDSEKSIKNKSNFEKEESIIINCIQLLYEKKYLKKIDNESTMPVILPGAKNSNEYAGKSNHILEKESKINERNLLEKKEKINRIYENVLTSYSTSSLPPYKRKEINSIKSRLYNNISLNSNLKIMSKIEQKLNNLRVPKLKKAEPIRIQKSIQNIIREKKEKQEAVLNSLSKEIKNKYNILNPDIKTEISKHINENIAIGDLSVLINEYYDMLKERNLQNLLQKRNINTDPKKLLNLLLLLADRSELTLNNHADLILSIVELNNQNGRLKSKIKTYLTFLSGFYTKSINSTTKTPNFAYLLKSAIINYNHKFSGENRGIKYKIDPNEVNSVFNNINQSENILDYCFRIIEDNRRVLELYIN